MHMEYTPLQVFSDDNPTDSKRCSRCGQYYSEINNTEGSCYYHRGVYNKDGRFDFRGWLCCRVFAYNAPGCTSGNHIEDYNCSQILASFARKTPVEVVVPVEEAPVIEESPPQLVEMENEQYLRRDNVIYFKHIIVPEDTITGVALKYSLKPQLLKKLNNMYGRDDEICLKKYLLIPLTDGLPPQPEQIKDDYNNKNKLMLLRNKFSISNEEATFYLIDANWDVDVAMKQYQLDIQFEPKGKKFQTDQELKAKKLKTDLEDETEKKLLHKEEKKAKKLEALASQKKSKLKTAKR